MLFFESDTFPNSAEGVARLEVLLEVLLMFYFKQNILLDLNKFFYIIFK